MHPQHWLSELDELRKLLEGRLGLRFNSVLANLYRDGHDSMGWHSDNEPELGDEPAIASISLGAERDFLIRNCDRRAAAEKHVIPLTHGSLLLMQGKSQQDWQHALPKRRKVLAPRINLTFRLIQGIR